MRRVFVLLLVCLISLQFVDEAFAGARVAVQEQAGAVSSPGGLSCFAEKVAKKAAACESAVSSTAHADCSDSVVMQLRWPAQEPAMAWLREVPMFTFPLRVFPLLEPPRV